MKWRIGPDGVIAYDATTATTVRFTHEESAALFGVTGFPEDVLPEIVHLEISDRCNLKCPYCYVIKTGQELPTITWMTIIAQLAAISIFQITFGGGEPTLRDDLGELVSFARSTGLAVCMTSNGINIPSIESGILQSFNQINISWHGNPIIVAEALSVLEELSVTRGVNFCFSKLYQQDLERVSELCYQHDAELLLLAYKPVIGDWENCVDKAIIVETAKHLSQLGLKIAVDGMTIDCCRASQTFCDIDSLGNVLPCSFIRTPMGNLLERSFTEIWGQRDRQVICPFAGQGG